VSLPEGSYTIRYNASDLAGNIPATRTFDVTTDLTRPTVTLVTPTTAGPFAELSIQVDAADANGPSGNVAYSYSGGTPVRSSQTPLNGATSGTHTATVALADGAYTIRFNAHDLAGNVSATGTFDVTIDTTPEPEPWEPWLEFVKWLWNLLKMLFPWWP